MTARPLGVLVVDDSDVLRTVVSSYLDDELDLRVVGSVATAREAVDSTDRLRPDVILLDLRMPGASGVQALRRMREQDLPAATIILTSYGDQAYVRQALEAGADGYLLKSTPPEQLIGSLPSIPVSPASVSFQPSPSGEKPRFSIHIGSNHEKGT